MLSKARSFLLQLHEDESGPTTVEWILLVIVGLVLLIAIVAFISYVRTQAGGAEGMAQEAAPPS